MLHPFASLRPVAEPMEERILHSADLSPLGWSVSSSPLPHAAVHEAALAPEAVSAATQAATQLTEIVFVDAGLSGAGTLTADLLAQQAAGRRIEVVTIDADADGLALISQTLAGRSDIGAVHVLSHSSDGRLLLGRTLLDEQTLLQRAGEIAGWSAALTADADLLFYGCDLAQGVDGQRLMQGLAALTGADVAASTDLTGAAARGGNWTLEFRTGQIEAAVAPSVLEQSSWAGLLATFAADPTKADGAIGSLRWAITQANAAGGSNIVTLAAGTYNLTLANVAGSEDLNATGDLDVRSSISFVGAGSGTTIVNATSGMADRVFDMRNSATASLTGLTIQGGASSLGAGMRVATSATVTMQDVVVQNNTGIGASLGGGIYSDGTLTLSQSIVRNNGSGPSGAVAGAGIYNYGTLVATNVEIRDNQAGTQNGGGLYSDNSTATTLQNVTLAGNQAAQGGGIYHHGNSATLTNVTLSGNTAASQGGGLWADRTVSLNHVTVAYNTAAAGQGGGVFNETTTVQTTSSLFVGNVGGNANVALTTQGYNADTDGSAGLNAATDLRPTEAALALMPLANYGGYVRTMALGSGSVAIDAGNPSSPATDARGVARLGTPDIGALEAVASGQLWFTTAGPATSAGGTSWGTGNIEQFGDAGDTFEINAGVTGGTVSLLSGYTAPVPIRALNIVQSGITVGTTGSTFTLNPGDLLMVMDAGNGTVNLGNGVVAGRQDIVVYRPTVAGNYASGSYSMLLQGGVHTGNTLYNVHGLSLIETPTTVGGRLLAAGTFVVSHSDTTLHNNVYTFSASGTGIGAATQTTDSVLLLDGAKLGYASGGDKIMGLHVLTQATAFNGKVLAAGTVLVSIDGGTNTYAGATMTAFDVVALTATGTGAGTAGTAQLLFDGSDLGLDASTGANTAAKNIQGLAVYSSFVVGQPVVNTAPTISAPATVAVTQDSSLAFSAANGAALTIGDAETGTGLVRLDLAATRGLLDLGVGIGGELRLNSSTANSQETPRIAVASDGHFVAVWNSDKQDGSKGTIVGRVFNADGSARSAEFIVNTTTTDDQTLPAVAIDASGRFVIAWQSYDTAKLNWDIYARSYNADGTALSAQKRITTNAGDQTAASVAMDASGNVVIAYQSNGQDNADGKEGIYLRTANVTLATIAAEVRVNTTTANAQTSPVVARSNVAGSSGYVVVWQSASQDGSGDGVYAQRYDSANVKQGSEFRVNVTTAGDQGLPAVAMDAAGRFTVAWQSNGQDGSGQGIVARRFDAAGTALSGEIAVNATTAFDQSAPAITVADNGRFAVSWTSIRQDNADLKEGVYLRSFGADGSALGAESRLNTTTLGVQSASAIGMAGDGSMFAVWQSNLQDGSGYGIYGQRLLAPGALQFTVGDGQADAAMSVTGTLADLNLALTSLRYTPDAGYWGPASLSVTVNDLGSGAGPALGSSKAVAIDVQKINVAPTTTVPGAQATQEDVAIVFSASNGNAIVVADVDADPDAVQVSLSVGNGTLTLSTLNGLTVVAGANGSGGVVVQGRLAALNSALDGLVYAPKADYFGSDTLNIVTDDLGHNTVGGPYSATGSVLLSIASVNDAPVNRLPATASVVEGGTLTLSTALGNAISIADVDAGTTSLEVTLTSTLGTLQLGGIKNLSFTVGTGRGGEDRMTFRGTLANINIALNGLQFTPLPGYAGPAQIGILSNDLGGSGAGGALSDRDVLDVTVTPGANNAAPTITVPGNQTTVEETPLVLSAATGNGISIIDDAGGLPLRVTLTVTDGTLTLGTTTGGEFQINSVVAGDQQAAKVAMGPDGRHVVVWQSDKQDGDGQGIYLQRYNDDGQALGVETRVNTTTAGNQAAPSVAMADDGSFTVVWSGSSGGGENAGIYGQRYAADGSARGGEFRIDNGASGNRSAAAVAADGAGNFTVVWQSKDQDGSDWGIYGRRYAADGTARGAEFRINTATLKDQTAPVVAMAKGGAFVVAWQSVRQDGDDLGIYAQRFDAAGAAAGAEFRVTTVTFKDQGAPAIAADAAGNFVIAWQSEGVDYNDGKFGIYAQRYAANGSLIGTQFLVNSTTPKEQTAPTVAMDGSGNFVIAWQSRGQDGRDDPAGVYAQRYDSSGLRQGGEFHVNTTTADAQTAPALAMSNNGKLLATWTADKQDGSGLGVFGQRFIDARSLNFSVGDGSDDATMVFTGTQEQINDVLDGLIFTPNKNFDGKSTLTTTVDDLGNSGSGGAKVSTKNFSITVTGVNDAPTIRVPASFDVAEGTPLVYSTASGRAVTVADPDAGNNKLLVTLTASVGTLTLGSTNGVQFTVGDGTADALMSFTGTLAQINTALQGLQQLLPAHYTGAAGVRIFVNDQGNTGTGGALTDNAATLATVLPDTANAAPVVTLPAPQRTDVDTPLTLALNSALGVIDDAGSSPLRLTLTVSNGIVTLSSREGAEAAANTTTLSDQTEARVAMLADGSHIVVWTNSSSLTGDDIYAQRFDASGARIGAEWRVNSTAVKDQNLAALASDASGGFAVAWVSDDQDGSGTGIYLQRYSATGLALGSETRVNTTIDNNQTAPSVAISASGAVVVAWQSADVSGHGVYVQRFDANGLAAGVETQVNLGTAGDQMLPAVATDAAGNFVVAWQGRDADNEGIFARRFDAAGNALSGEIAVNAVAAQAQQAPALAMNAAGAWAVAWQGVDANNAGVFARRFDAAGNALGSDFAVNLTTAGNQLAPSVAINAAGATVFAWQSPVANGDGVFARYFDAAGNAASGEILANTTTAGDQRAPSVGVRDDGTARVVWTADNLDGDKTGIGTQSLLRPGALLYSVGDGIADASMVFTGTLADINAALDGLSFTPNAGFVGVANLALSVDDLGSSGTGGARIGTGDVDIVVGNAPLIDLDANNSSGVSGADFRVNFRVGLGAVLVADADATLIDPNSGNLERLTVVLSNPRDGAAETLAALTNGTTIVANWNATNSTLTLSGSNSVANYQKVLRTVTYNNTTATPTAGSRSITFVAWDGSGDSNVATTTVNYGVTNTAPVAAADSYSVLQGQALTAPPSGVLGNDSDAEFDALSAVLVTGPAHGVLQLDADGGFRYTPDASFKGDDSFTYTASDGILNSGVTAVTLRVLGVNAAPTGSDATLTIDEDSPLLLQRASFGFADAGNTPADDFAGVLIAEMPAAGSLTLRGAAVAAGDVITIGDIDAGNLVYRPVANANGAAYARIGFRVRDDGGTANGADTDATVRYLTVNVTPRPDAPVLASPLTPQSATEGQVFAFTVSAGTFNDADAGDVLGYGATLADGSTLPPWLAFDAATRTFAGTPANADVGALLLRVTAQDPAGASAFADFTLTVANVNDPPQVAQAIADQAATQGQDFSFTVPAGSFIDIDVGDTLDWGARQADGSALPTWLSFNTGTRSFAGKPTNADVGAVVLRVSVTDAAGASSAADFTLTVANVNDPPQAAQPIADQAATQGQDFSFTVPAGAFADIDVGDTLGWGATRADGSALPSWLGFDAATRSFSGTPANADVGSLVLRINATDAAGASASADFALVVANVNDAPVQSLPLGPRAANVGSTFSFVLPAGTFTDIDDGDTLAYTATSALGLPLPGWLSFNGATQTFAGTPGILDIGAATIRITATDPDGLSASASFILSVGLVNQVPVLAAPIANQAATEDQGFSFTVPAGSFTDADAGDTLAYTATLTTGAALPGWLNFDAATRTFTGKPGNGDVGTLQLRVSVNDSSGASAFGDFTLAVANTNDAPTGSVTISGTPIQGQTLTAANSLADADGLGTIGYEWKADGVAISGATGSTLLLAQAQVGKAITVTASYTDGYGTAESVSSAATAAVTHVNDAPTGSVTITGTPTQGQTLMAANSLADIDGLGTISYQWQADGTAIGGANGSTFVLGQAQVGKAITVIASYTDGGSTAESVASAATALVANINDAPTGSVTIAGTPTQGQTLTAANSLADIDGLGTISYQWQADGTSISGATGSSLTLGQAQVGKMITVTASYTDGFGAAENVSSLATASVANINDAPTGSVSITGTPTQGQTLTASNTLADADGLGAISYQWQGNGVNIAGATGGALLLSQAQVGQTITVRATFTDGFGAAESAISTTTAAVANVNDVPTGSVNITGTPTQGQTLTASNTLVDADGLGTVSYQWSADGVAIGGATGSTLLLAQAQVGRAISVAASYTDGFGAAESTTSTATAAVANVNDAPTGSVAIAGTPTQGQTLTASNTLTDADGMGAISYQWSADGITIGGATGNTLSLTQAQVSRAISVTATFTDGFGVAESVTSTATAVVSNINDAPTGSVTITGTPTQGQTLTAANSLADIDGLGTISYQWQADGIIIAGATGSTLLLAQAQVGKEITVTASYTDVYGTAESVSSAATAVVANVNDAPTGTVTISGTPTQGRTLTAANSLADFDGLGAIGYQWKADGIAIAGATGGTLLLAQAQVGRAISVAASYTDGFGAAESTTSTATAAVANVNDAPTGSVAIAGTPTQGQTLTASNTLTDADGMGAISYQWSADGITIGGATGNTLSLTQAQVSRAISVTATFTDGFGVAESVTSTATAVVSNINDAPTGSVTITGTPTQGQTLTAANSLADIDGLGTISYQWQADGIIIAGATGSTLLLAQAQVGKEITVTASYTDVYGTAESVASATTTAVANINDAPVGGVTINGTSSSGPVVQGRTLTAANTLADADGLGTITYLWKADGVAIDGATGARLALTQAQVGKAISVTASYIDGYGTAESLTSAATSAVANVNDAPTGSVTITGTPTQGETLTAANSLADIDGLGTISYQWQADGTSISGATGSSLTLGQAQVGKMITVTASYTDGFGAAENVSSLATASVANINDAPTGSVSITGTPTQGQTLTASNTLADADGLGAISYQWQGNGVNIAGATGGALLLSQAQVGQTITVRATFTDGFGAAESAISTTTAAVANVNDVPTGSVNITGTPTQGQTLTASNTLVDADGLGTVSYQWSADGVAIGGATGSTLLLAQAQVGRAISVAASYTDGFGAAESTTSTATAAVANVNDAPTGSVAIAGTPTQGQTLTASNTLTDADGMGAISYQWSADGITIGGATGNTLSLTQAQVSRAISVTATFTDGFGVAESVTSTATAVVSNINDAPTGSVTITGTPTQGQTLTAANSLADIDGLGTISYQWQADGIIIAGATGSTLLLAQAQAQVGKEITVTASYTDGYGTAESVSSAATAVVANVNDAPTGTVTISGTPTQGRTLTAANSLADFDGLGAIGYQWKADGIAIAGATGGTLLLAQAQVGKEISVTASYIDGYGTAESLTSAATSAVANVNDAPTGSVTITGTPTQGQTLTAANSLVDADGLGAITYQWKADGIAIAGATGGTLLLAQAQVGKEITVTASYTDGYGTSESVSSAATAVVANVNDAPTGSVTITGTPTQGQTLTAANSLVDADGLGTIAYQWFADGAAISGASGSTLVLGQTQVSKAISVTASYTDGYGTAESVASSATEAVANVNDVPTGTVTITGTPTQGQTLTVANTLADADGLGAINYQWKADGVAIAGATGSTLLLAEAQVGKVISVTASYTDGDGSAEIVASAATAAVANVNDAPVSVQPLADRDVTAGSRLQFEVPQASFRDDDGDVLSYRATLADGSPLPAWLQFDAGTRFFNADPGAADSGVTTVRVTVTDAAGASARASFAVTVAPAPLVAAAPAFEAPAPAPAPAPAATPAPVLPAEAASIPSAPLPVLLAPESVQPNAFIGAPAPEEIQTTLAVPRPPAVAESALSAVRQAERFEAALQVARVDIYQTMSATRLSQLLQSDELLRRLQELQRQMLEPSDERQANMASGMVLTSGVSIGYIVWLVRGGVLVSSMLSALPVWQMVDPMPVLTAAGGGKRSAQGNDTDDQDIERLFGRPDDRHPATPPTPPGPVPAAHGQTLPGAQPPMEPDR